MKHPYAMAPPTPTMSYVFNIETVGAIFILGQPNVVKNNP